MHLVREEHPMPENQRLREDHATLALQMLVRKDQLMLAIQVDLVQDDHRGESFRSDLLDEFSEKVVRLKLEKVRGNSDREAPKKDFLVLATLAGVSLLGL
mmetsp:Transcript_39025/g.94802  ORF Transcript_39025/g.94802 Transcript_39025/m.94802 type:complete len:100 (-) Transcript_39025:105-404(-)